MSEDQNQRLRHVRRLLNLTQREFADELSIKQGSLSDIERGRIGVSEKIVDQVVAKFKISRTWLLSGAGKMSTNKDYKIQGINTGDYTGYNRKTKYKNALDEIKKASVNNIAYLNSFSNDLKNERPELHEFFSLLSQLEILSSELPRIYSEHLAPIMSKFDMLTADSYNEYKKQAICILEESKRYSDKIKPVVKVIKELIDGGEFPLPK